MQSNKLTLYRLRPINYEFRQDEILFSQGLTKVLVKHKPRLKIKEPLIQTSFKSGLKIFYDVSNLADKINHAPYRRGRRHHEIILFINKTLANLKLRGDLSIFMVNTDGSSRVTAINAIGLLMVKKQYTSIPLAMSFGYYNGEIKLDLNYEEDSKGEGDCAISFNYTPYSEYNVSYILYEGTMSFDNFMKGLTLAQNTVMNLATHYMNLAKLKQ